MALREQHPELLVDDTTGKMGYKNPVTNKDVTLDDPGNVVYGLAAYTGFVATRGIVSNNRRASDKQANTRTAHWARDAISSLRLLLGNYSVLTTSSTPTGSGAETGAGGSTTYEAAIEYPEGTFTRVTFSGSNQGVAADGATLTSDSVPVSIPRGARFYVRQFISSAGNLVYASTGGMTGLGTALGEQAEFAVSGASSKVMGGSIAAATTINIYPVAIIGLTSRPSVLLLTDSRGAGQADALTPSGDLGHVTKCIGSRYAYAGSMVPSDRATWFNASNTQRLLLVPYASHILVNYGVNDLNGLSSAFQTLTAMQTAWASIAAVKQSQARIYQSNFEPWTTSTDSWLTVANQTVMSWEANRTSVNDSLRGTTYANLDGFVEVADILESGRNTGKWQVTGVANGYTPDGVHAGPFGNVAVQRSALVLSALGL